MVHIGLSIMELYADMWESSRTFQNLSTGSSNGDLRYFLPMSAAANGVATCLIMIKFWHHHKLTKVLHYKRRSYVEKVLIFLMESGAVYCAFQIFNIALFYCPVDIGGICNNYTKIIVRDVYYFATAAYPLMVILFVNASSSIDETFSLPTAPPHELGIEIVQDDTVAESGKHLDTPINQDWD
ncbi:hypothetical protein DXG01_005639 [Tephrocybe rancida]|nr:hypothetical protein DXG01_005639 [Tephrocybe rancida]